MKVRKLAVALALAGGLGSGVAQALGLGEIELQSYLNEPLDAEIVLPQSRGVDPGDVFVNIASETAYERVGLSRNQFLSKLRFQVITQNDGSLAVNVSSREPLREPYLNFLLELTWPSGRLMREYAVLVDPPVYAEESGVEERVAAPSTSSAAAASQPTSTRSAESVRRQAQAEQTLSRGYQAETFGPTGPSDTLWTIASRVRPDSSVSMQQVMLALQDLNPNAFIGENINRLKRGEVLRVPTLDQIQSRTRAEATRVVGEQNRDFQSPQRTVDASESTPEQAAPAPAQASAGGDELKLLVAENDSRETSEGGSAGGDGQLPGGVDAGSAVAMEELESARRENDELNNRVDDLQDQVETLQRLLELKNTQLSDLQSVAGQAGSDEAPAESQAGTDAAGNEQIAMTEEGADTSAPGEAATEEAGEQAETVPAEGSESESMGTGEAPVAADDMVAAEGESAGDTDMAGAEEPEPADAVEPVAQEAEPAETAEAAPTATEEEAAAQSEPKPVSQAPAAEKAFPGNIIDLITNNLMYQIALGGGLILLLLLLLLLARRNANREKAFYEQLNSESDDDTDSFDLSLDDDESEQMVAGDAVTEADTYIAYGRHDQAAQSLETAISREPSRVDLRLKLLGVYADIQDRESFEKQFGEIEALDDEEALSSASELRSRLEEAESMPSIDDLESELRSDSFGSTQEEGEARVPVESEEDYQLSDELLADQYDSEREEKVENEFGDFDSDLADFDLSEFEGAETSAVADEESKADEKSEGEGKEGFIEYDLSGTSTDSDSEDLSTGTDDLDLDENEEPAAFEMELEEPEDTQDLSEDVDLESSLEDESEPAEAEKDSAGDDLSLALDEDEPGEKTTLRSDESSAESEADSLDESFLDELDAELDKVANEEEELGGKEMEESSLDDLELDVSDEDLALMEEFSDSSDSSEQEEETSSLDEELGLEDTLGEGDVLGESESAGPEEEVSGAEELEDLGSPGDVAEQEESSEASDDGVDLPVASEKVGGEVPESESLDIDERDLGDDDDFDFLAGTDEAATKLDLARAYVEMGDSDGARDILEEVALEGDEDQKSEAQDLLKKLS
ncbi:hypothetical protein KFJ24_05340 [Marinobacter sediminum]|uniref:FimV/HubP family polar landmark protein n=1 Tax=Marinobacter sediminum TaxID=256323 RepID=UPI002030D9E0|nr:FimV/HubP family polar landmark protein [Marinobacter sediminum]MCM0611898.1 hypothetical protein [Marinobacter sediminum]